MKLVETAGAMLFGAVVTFFCMRLYWTMHRDAAHAVEPAPLASGTERTARDTALRRKYTAVFVLLLIGVALMGVGTIAWEVFVRQDEPPCPCGALGCPRDPSEGPCQPPFARQRDASPSAVDSGPGR